MADNQQEVLTVKEACAYLRISRTTMHRLRLRGELRPARLGVGKGLRFRRCDLDRLMELSKRRRG